ncbi:MAG TPA: Ig-like domain-containing protein [Thermoleophilaceae bacterium]|nr:Ig-like domain-containing protein [Thermoleophilaceae bacterium]
MRPRHVLISLALVALAAPAAAPAGVRHQGALSTLRKAEAVRHGEGPYRGAELTPLLKELSERLPYLDGAERGRAKRLMMRPSGNPQPGEEAYAVPEAPQSPYCSPHFCVHWVAVNTPADRDAPPSADADINGIPDYVETMSAVSEHVYEVENVQMGWREPVGDGSRGGDVDKTDVYLKQIGDDGIYGYSTPDPNQGRTSSQFAYLVMDNDFSQDEFPRYSNPVLPMEVTAAHEYNHILQFGYDWLQDTWMFEATATWAEDKVYDEVNDYVSYLKSWSDMTQVPLTTFNALDFSDPVNLKVYGDAVWARWLEAHFGEDVVRAAWEHSLDTSPPSFAPAAFDMALQERGSSFFRAFTRFAADTAEWRSTAGPFEEGPKWPDVHRSTKKTLTPGTGASGQLDHTAFALHNVSAPGSKRIKLVGKLPRGTAGAFALVGRTGPVTTGAVEVHLKRLPDGGRARVEVERPGRFTRLTAVLINADVAHDGFRPELGDWAFRADSKPVSALITEDFAPPRVVKRSPRPDTRDVSRRTRVSLRFTERVRGVSTRTLKLLSPDGRKVNARVTYDRKRRRARLEPKDRLRRHTGYVVKITGGIVDGGGNGVPDASRTWTFRTGG